jgi:hypothetical protein
MSRPKLSSRLNKLEVNTNCAEKFLTFEERLSKTLYPVTYMDIGTLLPSKTGLFFAPIEQTVSLCPLFQTSFSSHSSLPNPLRLQTLDQRRGACPRSDLSR